MLKTIDTALRMAVVTLALTGLAYPLLLTGSAQLLFPQQARGSWVVDQAGRVVGSAWIGQGFSNPAYFQSRPSAAGAGYDGAASSGSNLGPTSAKLRRRIEADVARLTAENPGAGGPIPVELVLASGSGLDPHLSPAAADWQVARVAAARGADAARVRAVLAAHIEDRQLGLLGEPRVNVLRLNQALDQTLGRAGSSAEARTGP